MPATAANARTRAAMLACTCVAIACAAGAWFTGGLLADAWTGITGQSGVFVRALAHTAVAFTWLGVAALPALWLLARTVRRQHELLAQEHGRLDEQVNRRTRTLRELTQHVQLAREDERGRLARDLHDELGALLTSAKLDAARIRSRLGDTAPEAQERLAHLVSTLNEVIALKRRITEDLRPSTLAHFGLATTLGILARDYSERSGTQVHCNAEDVHLRASAELVIYRLVQEAITNITKYAHARNVWITLRAGDGHVDVEVRDDGVGFTPEATPASSYGLVGMRYRVEAEAGEMSLTSTQGGGTRIHARLPRVVADSGG